MGILEDVVINAKSAANAVGKSATKLYDLSKLKVSAADLNGDINEHFEALGRIVYDGKQNGKDNSALIEDSVKIIKDLYESLAAINQQIDELKNLVKCPKCGFENSLGSNYCNCCGAKIAKEPVCGGEAAKTKIEECDCGQGDSSGEACDDTCGCKKED